MKKLAIIIAFAAIAAQPALAQPQKEQPRKPCPGCSIENPEKKRERVQNPSKKESNPKYRHDNRQRCPHCPYSNSQN